jgi:predicted TIM-barrel fold metal-dependent hydrolase
MTQFKIDVHHHILPHQYVDAIGGGATIGALGSSGRLPEWSVQGSLATMDKAGITAAVTSVSAPGLAPLDSERAAALARVCNEFAAQMARDQPHRFGFFAMLPLQSIEQALREVEHAFDILNADGACLLSNYGGRYLGDSSFLPLYEELNRRGAVVFVHPTSPANRVDLPGISTSMLEFPFDTTRTIASLIFSGVTRRFPAIRWIFSHAGGALPYLAGRFEMLSRNSPPLREQISDGFYRALQPLYFDSALSADAIHFAALRALLPDSQILFGTDYPFGPKDQMADSVRGLDALELPAAAISAIYSANARCLFPRFRSIIPLPAT